MLNLLLSCTTVRYTSDRLLPVKVGSFELYKAPLSIYGELDFFLWGNFPNKHIISIDQELEKINCIGASNLTIEEYQTNKNIFYSILTFGMYTPISYKISFLGEKVEAY